MIRVRFAPSPTGFLHIGGARTALFNWLFARRHRGVFVLRIEDTDADRSSPEMVSGILEGLQWLGLDWDEGPGVGGPSGPYFQSDRIDGHRRLAERLVETGHAYYCYCSPETLTAKREAAERGGHPWTYDRTCAGLSQAEVAHREEARLPRAIRFRVPAGIVRFDDLVHGPIEVDGAGIEDFVVLRADGHPTYHLSVVADDVAMGMTHVVRGDDHISNTPKQLLIYGALGAAPPRFAHVPLILGPDKKRLSKRHGATSVMEYARQGYLPEALLNFLALLGWSPGGDREIFIRDDLVGAFSLEGIGGGHPIFNPDKLDWFNAQHIARLNPDELVRRVRPFLESAGLWVAEYESTLASWLAAVLELLKPRVRRMDDFIAYGKFFFTDQLDYDQAAVDRYLPPASAGQLAALEESFDVIASFDAASIEENLRAVAEAQGAKAATLIHAVRVAVTGKGVSPGLFEVVALLGRDRVRTRLDAAIRRVSVTPA